MTKSKDTIRLEKAVDGARRIIKPEPMTQEEEYRNADVPMPVPYNGGVAYTSFVKMIKGTNGRKTDNKD